MQPAFAFGIVRRIELSELVAHRLALDCEHLDVVERSDVFAAFIEHGVEHALRLRESDAGPCRLRGTAGSSSSPIDEQGFEFFGQRLRERRNGISMPFGPPRTLRSAMQGLVSKPVEFLFAEQRQDLESAVSSFVDALRVPVEASLPEVIDH